MVVSAGKKADLQRMGMLSSLREIFMQWITLVLEYFILAMSCLGTKLLSFSSYVFELQFQFETKVVSFIQLFFLKPFPAPFVGVLGNL